MAMQAPTAVFDPLVAQMARDGGVDPAKLASIIGGNVEGALITVVPDMLLTKLGAKIAELLGGGFGLYYAMTGLKGRGRVQDDAAQISTRVLTAVIDPTPNDLREIQANFSNFWNGILQGRWDQALWAFIRRPEEYMPRIGSPFNRPPPGDKTPGKETPPQGAQGQHIDWG